MRTGPRGFAAMVSLLLVALAAGPARADGNAVIDRVDLEPSVLGGARLRVFVSALNEQGGLHDLSDPKAIKLLAPSEIKAPYALGTFAATQTDLAIVFVIQATPDFQSELQAIADQIDLLLGKLGDRTQIAIVPFGEAAGAGKLTSINRLRGKGIQLSVEGGAEPALSDTLEAVLPLLKKAKTEPPGRTLRKLIVIIGDGRDLTRDRERITNLGTRAAREGVRLHSLAFSPVSKTRSMLTLGELSKRSLGTFRLVLNKVSWSSKFDQLRDEINQQNVLTYFLGPDLDVAGKRIKLTNSGRVNLTSNEAKVPALACNGEPCDGYCAGDRCNVPRGPEGRGAFGWIFLIVGVLVGLAIVLGVIGFVMSKRQQPAAPGVAPVPGVPGSRPPKAKAKSKPPKNLPSAPPVPAPVLEPTSGPRLYILSGARQGETIGLRNGFAIGAAPNSDLVIQDGFASGQHAQIGLDAAGNCWVYDRGSTNGTFVNGVRVTQQVLDHGTSLRIGSTELRYLVQ